MRLVIKLARERSASPLCRPPRSLFLSRFALDGPPPDAPLTDLRARIAALLHLPPADFKLIHAGALLKDDNASLAAYSLRPNSSITVLPHAPPPRDTLATPRSEQSVIALIHAELAAVRTTLSIAVDSFLASPHQPRQAQHKEHTRLGELLLQALLRIDGVPSEGDWQHARQERKAAVREVQALLDRLDGRWAEIQNSNL